MSGTNGNGRILSLNDHRPAKPTRAEQEKAQIAAIDARVRAIAAEVTEHYIAQMPGLVATMVGEILHANGFELKAPESWKSITAVAPNTEPDANEPPPETGQ